MITAEILPASASVEHLRADWDRLYRADVREPSVSFEWSHAILRNHLAADRDWFIVVLKRGPAVEAIIPMLSMKERVLGREVITLQPIQEKNNTHSDLLISGHDPELVGAWLDALLRMDRPWHMLRMSRLLEHSTVLERLESEVQRRRLPFRLRLEQPSYHLTLPATYEDYLARRSSKFRNYLKRAEKSLLALGEVGFDCAHESADFDTQYGELLAVEQDSWKHAHGTAISAIPHQTGFYRDLCEETLRSGMLHLTFLRVGGSAVAYNLGLIGSGRYFYLKTSYRHEYREHGVATIGRARLIRQLIGAGLREFDFPGEPYEWEQQWTNDTRWHRSLLLYNRGIESRMLWLLSSLKDRASGTSEERKIAFRDARALQPPKS